VIRVGSDDTVGAEVGFADKVGFVEIVGTVVGATVGTSVSTFSIVG